MRIIIEGDPFYQKRHRHGRGGTWNPSKKDKKSIKIEAQSQVKEMFQDVPLAVTLTAFYRFRKSGKDYEGKPKITKPDIDNVCKIYLDALNNVAYSDDNIITSLIAEKVYSEKPCVCIEIKPYEQ